MTLFVVVVVLGKTDCSLRQATKPNSNPTSTCYLLANECGCQPPSIRHLQPSRALPCLYLYLYLHMPSSLLYRRDDNTTDMSFVDILT